METPSAYQFDWTGIGVFLAALGAFLTTLVAAFVTLYNTLKIKQIETNTNSLVEVARQAALKEGREEGRRKEQSDQLNRDTARAAGMLEGQAGPPVSPPANLAVKDVAITAENVSVDTKGKV